jgi:MFS family permease
MSAEPARAPRRPAAMESRPGSDRLVLVVSFAVFLDTLFYAVITPMLPQLTQELHLSKLSAGVMTAAYPAGMLVASLPAGALAVRYGPRATVISGLVLLVISTVAFGLLDTAVGLNIARFIEGVGGACSWAGGLAWIVAVTSPERRGAVMGKAVGTSIAGALFGPAVGALASVTGRAWLFCGLALVASLLLIPVSRLADARESSGQPVSDVLRMLNRQPLRAAMWLLALPAIVSGALNVLGPLQLNALGAGAGVIGATFLLGAGFEALISPAAGRFSDEHGRTLPLSVGLIGVGVGLACFTLPSTDLLLGLLMVAIATVLGIFWAPVMALVTDIAEANGIDQAHAAALMNLAWAGGQIVGSAGAGATAKAVSDAFATLFIAGLCMLTLLGLRRGRLLPRPYRPV